MRIFPINNIIQTHKVNNTNRNNFQQKIYNKTQSDVLQINKNVEYIKAISFEGITAKGLAKQRGIYMHITSLPSSRSFCGQFGDPQVLKFIKWIKDAKQTHWIMNPLNALEEDLCPYNATGRFSRNKFIVNLNKLTTKEYGKILSTKDLPDDISTPDFTLEMLEKQKNPRFKKAFLRFQKLPDSEPIKQEYNAFINKNNTLWLDDYANYDALSQKFGHNWLNWDKELQTAPEDAKREGILLQDKILKIINKDKDIATNYTNNVEQYKFEQFLYDKQFNEMVEYLNKQNIRLIMDLPIGVSPKGADVWGKKNIFLLDKNFKPTKVSGCPTEKAYSYTQVWGHALYDYNSPEFWEYQEASIRQLLKNADLRLDHFVGYINRAAIPTTFTTPEGKVLKGHDIFKPVEEGGMGKNFFQADWIENIYDKKSPKGENVFELFIRIAKELGKKPEDTFILENFGPLAKTIAYKNFDKKYGKNFVSQRVPIGMNICDPKNKINFKTTNIAILTGNHDLPPLKEFVDNLLNTKNKRTKSQIKIQDNFKNFCKNELKLTDEEMNDRNKIYENLIKWHYIQNVEQVQTTIQDALGIYYRPNIPGFWNGMKDKFLMKTTPEAMLPYWSKVFPRDFLTRDNPSGINAGYKPLADNFVKIMNELYPNK